MRESSQSTEGSTIGRIDRWAKRSIARHEDDLGRARDAAFRHRSVDLLARTVKRFGEADGAARSSSVAFSRFVSVVPLAMLGYAVTSTWWSDEGLGSTMSRLFEVDPATARIFDATFPSTDRILAVGSVITLLSLLGSGNDAAQSFVHAFCDCWRVDRPHGIRATARGVAWFAATFAIFCIGQMLFGLPFSPVLEWVIALVTMALCNLAFWYATPSILSPQQIDRSEKVRTALIGGGISTVMWLAAHFVLPNWFQWYGSAFGGVGVAIAIASWSYVVSLGWVAIAALTGVVRSRS